MTPMEATTRAREAVLVAVLPVASMHDPADLVAVCEASGGLCPRKGRALLGALVRVGLLVRVGAMLTTGPRYRVAVKENLPVVVGTSL